MWVGLIQPAEGLDRTKTNSPADGLLRFPAPRVSWVSGGPRKVWTRRPPRPNEAPLSKPYLPIFMSASVGCALWRRPTDTTPGEGRAGARVPREKGAGPAAVLAGPRQGAVSVWREKAAEDTAARRPPSHGEVSAREGRGGRPT